MTIDFSMPCDCCGIPFPRKGIIIQIEDDLWSELNWTSVWGNLALNPNGEDWLCPSCMAFLRYELRLSGWL